MIRKVVLPAAGHGTRLRPLTRFIPKEMLPVGDRLVIQHVLEECRAAGLDSILAVVSRAKGALVEAMEILTADEGGRSAATGDGLYPQVCYVYQRVQGGLGHAVLHAEAYAGSDHFAVALADTIIEPPTAALSAESSGAESREPRAESRLLSRLIAAHEGFGAAVTVAVEEVPHERLSRYGVVRPEGVTRAGEAFRILDLVEKPAPEAAPSNLAITARYVLSPEIFAALRETGRLCEGKEELQLTDAMAALARAGRPVIGVRLAPGERRRDIGTVESYAEAFQEATRHGDACRP
jgi:UTP--glucose-1-phosphate uridylyltransferase